VAVAEEAVMADAVEPGRKHVEQEPPEELGRVQRHRLFPVVVPVVPPAETDLPLREGEEAVVGDGDPVGVAPEILQDLCGAPERGLRIDHPLGLPERRQRLREGLGVLQGRERSREVEVPARERGL
jgi:hypothetical protein